jgi:hypothetical protein
MDEQKKNTPEKIVIGGPLDAPNSILKGISPAIHIAAAENEAAAKDKEDQFANTGTTESKPDNKFRCTRIIQIPDDVFTEFSAGIEDE